MASLFGSYIGDLRFFGSRGTGIFISLGQIGVARTHMVEQRITLDVRKAKREEHMMQHMQMGKESASQCPMI
jgi:hypothetical protein